MGITRAAAPKRLPATRTLGIDPGTVRTGWGVVEPYGPRHRLIAAGTLKVPEKASLAARLLAIGEGLDAVIAEHAPEAVAVEDIFFSKHANAALKLGHARGVALLCAARAGLAVHEYPASLVKRSVAGGGRASKEQVARLVAAILGMKTLPGVDATDALAVALTHLQAARMGLPR